MQAKRWFILFICALMLAVALWAGINLAVDPFNAFGDKLFTWDSYTQTLDPRNGKTVYIKDHFDEYDSYVIGSSNASSYLPATLNECFGGSFYNMFHYGSDTDYDKRLVEFLVENDDVKKIFLVLGLSEADNERTASEGLTDKEHYAVSGESKISYYTSFLFADPNYAFEKIRSKREDTELPKAFDVFIPESGCYDKRVRDVEPIDTLEEYLSLHSEDFIPAEPVGDLADPEKCIADVAAIKDLCDKEGAELTVVVTPFYDGQLAAFSEKSIDGFFKKLADVTDYYNFAISPISGDARYFYDLTHTRNAAADMVINAVAEKSGAYRPDGFGYRCTADSYVTCAEMKKASDEYIRSPMHLPVLMYHSIDDSGEEADLILRSGTFRSHMKYLFENGYHTVSIGDIEAAVEKGTPLPEKPVLITFDDGYMDNYENAFPVLKEYGFKAVIFTIGFSFGQSTYKDTGLPIIPHFGKTEALEMVESGLVTLQSHTYDMHQWADYESSDNIRSTMLPFEDEDQSDYMKAVSEDVEKQNALFDSLGLERPVALSFPSGMYEATTDAALASSGIKITFDSNWEKLNELVPGLAQSAIDLGRLTVGENITEQQLGEFLSR